MPKTKTKKKTKQQDYYAAVTIQAMVYFKADDQEDAENVAEAIIDEIKLDSGHVYESIDYDGHEVTEINLHE